MSSATRATAHATGPAVELLNTAMLTPEGRRDPYRYLAQLHDHGEAVRMPEGYLAVWGYKASMALMRSPAWGRQPPDPTLHAVWQHRLTDEQAEQLRREEAPDLGLWLQLIDGPDHRRQRALVNRAFSPRRLEQLREHIAGTAAALVDQAPRHEPIDFMSEIAYPIPTHVIGELVGLPVDDRDWFTARSSSQRVERDPGATFEQLLDAVRARRELAAYIRQLVDVRRRKPREDLLSDLIRAEAEGEQLSEPELLALVLMMYIAGHSTTAQMLGNGVTALLRHPDELARLRSDRALLPRAVEEILRYDTMVVSVDYCSVTETELAGIPVPARTPAHVFLGAANWDPRVFIEPSRFDAARDEGPAIAFGAGPHYCLGAALARLEGEVVLGVLLDRVGSIELADPDPPRQESFNYRNYTRLPVILRD